jgi:hypothetical protein
MSKHLSEQGVSMYLMGEVSVAEREHVAECALCQAEIARLETSLSHFRGAVREWSERENVNDRAAELRWTVIPASDPLKHLLLPASVDTPWYRSLWRELRDALLSPQVPPLDITAKPVLVREIWGQYGHQKRSWVMSIVVQSTAVLLLFGVFSSKAVQRKMVSITLFTPELAPYASKTASAKDRMAGGGGGLEGASAEAVVEAVHPSDGCGQ